MNARTWLARINQVLRNTPQDALDAWRAVAPHFDAACDSADPQLHTEAAARFTHMIEIVTLSTGAFDVDAVEHAYMALAEMARARVVRRIYIPTLRVRGLIEHIDVADRCIYESSDEVLRLIDVLVSTMTSETLRTSILVPLSDVLQVDEPGNATPGDMPVPLIPRGRAFTNLLAFYPVRLQDVGRCIMEARQRPLRHEERSPSPVPLYIVAHRIDRRSGD